MEKKWKTIIESKTSPFNIQWKEIWKYKDLCFTFVRKNFITRYKQTIFGPFYLVMAPLLTSGLFTLIFGKVVGVSTDGAPEFLFYMISNLIWSLFSGVFQGNSGIFTANAYIMGKVYFPRLVVPISNVITQCIDIGVQFVLFILFYIGFVVVGYDLHVNAFILLVPVFLIQIILLGLGLGLIISSLTVKYRDLGVVTGFAMKVLMYASPILYPISSIDEGWIRDLAMLNPLAAVLECVRYAFFNTGYVSTFHIVVSLIISIIVIFIGLILFNTTEKTFIDTV